MHMESSRHAYTALELEDGHSEDNTTHNVLTDTFNKPVERPYLNGLRGCAAICVTFWHTSQLLVLERFFFGFYLPRTFPFTFFLNGPFMVSLFFVLSGRVLTVSAYVKARHSKQENALLNSLTSSFIRRPFRLMLPVLPLLVLLWLIQSSGIMIHAHSFYVAIIVPEAKDTYAKYFNLQSDTGFPTIRQIFRYFWLPIGDADMLYEQGALWTIPVELQYSYSIFLLAFVTAKHEFLGLAAILVTMFVHLYIAPTGNDNGSLPHFLGGLLLCHIEHGMPTLERFSVAPRTKRIFIGFCLFLSLVLSALFNIEVKGPEPFYSIIYGVAGARGSRVSGAMATLIAIEHIPLLQSFFSSQRMIYLGRISFGLYLMHSITIYLVDMYMMGLIRAIWPHCPYSFLIFLSFIVGPLACIPAGALFTILVDEPVLKFTHEAGKICLDEDLRRVYKDRLKQILSSVLT